MSRQLFPLGKAYGEAFCNRTEETKTLISNFENTKHTLLVAPRRFGKSSLAEKAIAKSKLPAVKLNFHLCTSEKETADLILSHIVKLLGIAIGPADKIISLVKKFLKTIHPKLSFFGDIAAIELVTENKPNYAVVIAEALVMLDSLLAEKKKKAIMFLDEFQEITKIAPNNSIEGAIRTAAQEMQCLSIVFSGSIRSLLLNMFEDEKRPLYKLCRKIHLNRISADDYEKHIQKIAKKTWNKNLENTTVETLLTLSNRHPYYINYLCDTLWEIADNLPTEKTVHLAWEQVIREEWSDAIREISDLPMTQRRIMKYISTENPQNLTSRESSQYLDLATSSIATAVTSLVEKDYIEAGELGYKIINPLLKAVLNMEEPRSNS